MNRIEAVFNKKDKPVFISYLTAGHPTLEKTPALVKAMEEGGAEIVEIGIPYSDPLADGPVIQSAAQKALAAGATVDKIFAMIPNIRKETQIPLILMVYFSTIYRYDIGKFIKNSVDAGIDGLIIPDMPLEEREEILSLMDQEKLAFIPLVAPTTKDRLSKVIAGGSGFVYCVSTLGVTGEKGNFYADLSNYLKSVREQASLPIAVGFGISDRKDIESLAPLADGVIVGSALVRLIDETDGNEVALRQKVAELTQMD